jgi:DNA repair protein RAD16
MDRIHRLGQHRPVQAIKLVIEDSIESRIVQLQEKKSAMVDATVGFLLISHTTLLNHAVSM